MRNTDFLMESRVAVKAETVYDLPPLIEHPLSRPDKLAAMRTRCEPLRRPCSAHDIAAALLQLAR